MGLDTTHDCWHGPYSQFMAWRSHLNFLIAGDREGNDRQSPWRDISAKGHTYEGLELAWQRGMYDDQTDPLHVLMNHSDCEGDIPANICGPLADALEGLMQRRMPARGTYDAMRPTTERFIAGLRRAAAAGEAVGFH